MLRPHLGVAILTLFMFLIGFDMLDWYIRDIAGFFIAFSLFPLVVLLPGIALFRFALPAEWRSASFERRLGLGMIFALSVWPAVLVLAGRAGAWAMIAAAIPLACVGAALLFGGGGRPRLSFALKAAATVLAVSVLFSLMRTLPIPTEDGILSPKTLWDTQKHVAVVQMMLESGIPPKNLFWTPEAGDEGRTILGYYYQSYTIPALLQLASGSWVETRNVFIAFQAWVLLGFHALFLEILRSVAGDSPNPRIRNAASGGLLFVGSLLPVLKFDTLWLIAGDHFALFLWGAAWVPQHFTGGLSAMFGLLLLARADMPAHTATSSDRVRLGVTAAVALSNALASSIPVGVAAAIVGAVWLLLALWRRDMRSTGFSLSVGSAAVILALPVIIVMLQTHGTAHDGKGIVFGVRNPYPQAFEWMDHPLFAIITAPVFYVVHFGILLFGAIVCFTKFRSRLSSSPVTTLLAVTVVVSFLLATFVRSNIMNNDFGWRAIIPGTVVLAVLTIVTIENVFRVAGPLRTFFSYAFALGFIETGLLMVLHQLPDHDSMPDRNLAFRILWDEVDRRLPPDAVVQPQPYERPLTAAFLYRTRWGAMPDEHHAVVYGRSADEALERRKALLPLFWRTSLRFEEARAIARRFGIDFVAIENIERVAQAPEAWPQTVRPYFETPHFRVYDMR